MTIKEVGLSDAAFPENLLKSRDMNHHQTSHTGDIYEVLSKGENSVEGPGNSFLDKDLEAALDSFDNLFCRRCLLFDCRLHGCSQDLVFPVSWLLDFGYHCYKNCSCLLFLRTFYLVIYQLSS